MVVNERVQLQLFGARVLIPTLSPHPLTKFVSSCHHLRLCYTAFTCFIGAKMDFKVPSTIPQDLQIIQDLIGELPPPPANKVATPEPALHNHIDGSVESSDAASDVDSEREVEENILGQLDSDEESTPPMYVL